MESESSYDADELGQYQSLSTSAVVALVLGVLSPVAFSSLLLIVVPLFGFAVALWALARIRNSEGGLLGTRLAYCGLAFSVLFGVASVAKVQVRLELLRRQANETAELWLSSLAQGNADDALNLMTHKAVTQLGAANESVSTIPIFEAELSSAQLLRDPLAVALIERHQSGEESVLRSEHDLVYDLDKPRALFYYELPNAEAEGSLFVISLVRSGGNYGPIAWLIETWKTEDVSVP